MNHASKKVLARMHNNHAICGMRKHERKHFFRSMIHFILLFNDVLRSLIREHLSKIFIFSIKHQRLAIDALLIMPLFKSRHAHKGNMT